MVTVQSVVFILISVSICEKSLSRGNFTLKCICTVELHIYSRSNFLYEKILRTTCEERLKRKSDRKRQVPFPIALHFFFPLFSPSSLPFLSLFFFLIRCCVYSNIKRERFYASTPPFPLPPLSETHRTKIIEMKRR